MQLAQHPWLGYKLHISVCERRRVAMLVSVADYRVRKTTSYARYLMEVKLGRLLTSDEEVDHIDDDSFNDDINNLQILTPLANKVKTRKHTEFKCPVCAKIFRPKRPQRLHKPPCCSRTCGGIQSIKTYNQRKVEL